MRLILFELKKIIKGKIFLSMLICALFINVLALYETEKPDSLSPTFEERKTFYNEISNLSEVEKADYINREAEIVDAILLKEQIESPEQGSPFGGDRLSEEYNEVYNKYKEYLDGACDYDAAKRRQMLLNEAKEEFGTVSNYSGYLDSIQENAEKMLSFSIFGNTLSGFSKANIEKTAKDFKGMSDIETQYGIDDPVRLMVNSPFTELSVILILIAIAISLVTQEKDKQLFNIIKATPGGMGKTIAAKIGAAFICVFCVNILISISTAVFVSQTYGFGDLSRSVQSVPDMQASILRVNLYEFLGLHFIVKTLGTFVILILIMLIALITKRAIIMLGTVVVLSGAGVALTFIPDTNAMNSLKYLNLYTLLNPYSILHKYLNLNFFGKPVNVILAYALFGLICLFLFTVLCCMYYIRKKPLINSEKNSRRSFLPQIVHSNYSYFEWKKLMVLNKAVIIILAFVLFQSYSAAKAVNRMSSQDYYYKYYMDYLQGELTEEKERLILNEQQKFEEARRGIDELTQKRINNEISIQEFLSGQQQYDKTLKGEDSFNLIYNKYVYVKANPGALFFFDRGYEQLFGITNKDFSLDNGIYMIAVMILCICGLFSVEYKSGMFKVLSAAKYGIRETINVKLSVAALTAFMILLIAYVPELIYIGRFYGFPNLTSGLISIPALNYFGDLPIWGYIVLLYIIRYLALLAIVLCVSAVSLRLKNNIYTALCCVAVFLLPLIMYKIGYSFLNSVSLFGILSGGVWVSHQTVWLAVIQAAVLIVISAVSKAAISKRFGKQG